MTKTRIEICIISARGLGRSPSLLKPQWFAVGWVDPNSKYCTKIYSSGNQNPTWKTKFIFDVDDRSSNLQDLSLTVEIHKREPIFLRDKLHGTANIMLKEFFAKFSRETDAFRTGFDEAGSFQLRKKISGRPRGFVDISVNISEEREGVASHSGRNGSHYTDRRNNIALAVEDGPVLSYPTHSQAQPPPQFNDYYYSYPYGRQLPPSPSPSPQAPTNSGLLPTLLAGPRTRPLESYVNLPASGNAGTSSGFGVVMGLGAGALAAGALIFGDDFMSGMSFPAGLDGGSLTVSTNPPF